MINVAAPIESHVDNRPIKIKSRVNSRWLSRAEFCTFWSLITDPYIYIYICDSNGEVTNLKKCVASTNLFLSLLPRQGESHSGLLSLSCIFQVFYQQELFCAVVYLTQHCPSACAHSGRQRNHFLYTYNTLLFTTLAYQTHPPQPNTLPDTTLPEINFWIFKNSLDIQQWLDNTK